MTATHPIAIAFEKLLAAAIVPGAKEPDIVRNYVDGVAKLPATPGSNIQAAFIHQKPYAIFIHPPSLAGRVKCELGDILYVFKYKSAGAVLHTEASFIQVKVGHPAKSWAIEPHQLAFLTGIRTHHFKFGNSVYNAAGVAPIPYRGLPHTGNFGEYMLIGGPEPLCYSADAILSAVGTAPAGTKVGASNPINCVSGLPFCAICDSHGAFLDQAFNGCRLFGSGILTPPFFGVIVQGPLVGMLNIIYKRVGMIPDPPEEYEGYFDNEEGGFGLIEVTIDLDWDDRKFRKESTEP